MTDEQVQQAVAIAIESLKRELPALDFQSVHERSTAHRLAVQLEPHFETWNVDCEYERDGQLKKSLMGIAQCNSQKATDEILPDIIVHHRQGRGRDHNLLVVELKKDTDEDACDKRKLELLTALNGWYQYRVGLYINISGGRFACTWYKDGARSRCLMAEEEVVIEDRGRTFGSASVYNRRSEAEHFEMLLLPLF